MICNKQQSIILMRYGFDITNDGTLQEIANYLNISSERVRQIEYSAIKDLKHPKINRNLKNYVEL